MWSRVLNGFVVIFFGMDSFGGVLGFAPQPTGSRNWKIATFREGQQPKSLV